jgi:biopolymer transport protein TolR
MAMNLGGRGGRGRYKPLSEINVTPMVDVMLVLLIVFMVAAPLMTSGVNVDLPKTNAAPVNQDVAPITVSIKADGSTYVGDDVVAADALVAKLRDAAKDDPAKRIFVRGDRAVTYGQIMTVMGTITSGGFTKATLLAEQGEGVAQAPGAGPAAGAAGSGATASGATASGATASGATGAAAVGGARGAGSAAGLRAGGGRSGR